MLRFSLLSLLSGIVIHQSICLHAKSVPYRAPLYGADHPDRRPDGYLVAFTTNYTIDQHWETIGKNLSNLDRFVYYDVLFGYHAKMSATTLDIVRADPNVTFVETDRAIYRHEPPAEPHNTSIVEDISAHSHGKRAPSWSTFTDYYATYNLQMVGAGQKLSNPIDYKGEYEVLSNAGQGVNIYILDSGIRITHNQFDGRARNFGGLPSNAPSPYLENGEIMNDLSGHGSAVAGIAGARNLGVAIAANLVNVKVLPKTGPAVYSQVIKAVNDVSKEHNDNRANLKGWAFRGSVMNLSIGTYGSAFWLGQAIGWARWYGINIVGSAGNMGRSTSESAPCYWSSVMCVASVDNTYTMPSWSDYGSEIDYLLPGVDVWSVGILTDNAAQTWRGNSFATPHLSGLAAIFTSWKDLTTGGADGYTRSNSLTGICEGYIWKNRFGISGIRDPRKYPNEPFRWARDDPVALPLNTAPVPIAQGSGIPPGATQSTDILTLTTSGGNSTMAPPTTLQTEPAAGLDTAYDDSWANGTALDGVTMTSVPASILSDLGITNLGKPGTAVTTTPQTTTTSLLSPTTTFPCPKATC